MTSPRIKKTIRVENFERHPCVEPSEAGAREIERVRSENNKGPKVIHRRRPR